MSERCELCGDTRTRWSNVTTETGTACHECARKALRLLKRVESGESVEIRKVEGEWPDIIWLRMVNLTRFIRPNGDVAIERTTYADAAAAWNKLAEQREDGE